MEISTITTSRSSFSDFTSAHSGLAAVADHYRQALSLAHRSGDGQTEGLFLSKLAQVEQELGRMSDARTHASRAAELFHQLADPHSEALSLATVAAAEASSGNAALAASTLDEAEAMLSASSDPIGLALIALNRGHVDLADARRAMADNNFAGAKDSLRSARLRIVKALMAGPATSRSPGGESSLAEQSDDARIAVRMLQRNVDLVVNELDNVPPTQEGQEAPSGSRRLLVVGPDGCWFRAPGLAVVRLDTRKPLRRLLVRLVDLHFVSPEAALDVPGLFEAGWPGDQIAPAAAANRVYVALTTLRKFGLREVLINGETGYRLRPDLQVVRSNDA
jgi:hypothetical protein